jgi:ABC-2 type transport system permease protein
MIAYYIRLEIVRMLRDLRFIALAVVAPIGFYLLFATLFGGQPAPPGELGGNVEIMVAMAAYGAMWAVMSTTGPRIAQEREIGWLQQVHAMPVRSWQLLTARVVASLTMALPAIVLVCATAAVVKGVDLSVGQWLGIVGSMWIGAMPFAALGIAIGYAFSADAAFPVSYGLYMALSAIGGLWVPPAVLPESFRQAARALPSNRLADLGWQIAGGHAIQWSSVGILVAWTVGLALIAVLAYRPVRLRLRSKVPSTVTT